MEPVIIVHGGAGTFPPDTHVLKLEGVKEAVNEGYRVLTLPEGSALDAVEAAVKVMEDNPIFNAGIGSSLTISGDVEMIAIIMEGTQMNAGAVAVVSQVRNPVALARQILEQSDHVILSGSGAHEFAQNIGMPLIQSQELITSRAQERLENLGSFNKTVDELAAANEDHDTVGAVAIDSSGHLACATSSGGLTGQQNGRISDAAIVGAGAFADDSVGAASATGHGEAIMRTCLCRHVIKSMQHGMSAQDAAATGLEYMKNRVQGHGGVICLSKGGDIGVLFTTRHMPWAYRTEDVMHYGLKLNEDISEVLS